MRKTSPEYARLAVYRTAGPEEVAALDRLIDNHALAVKTIHELRRLWERHTTHNHTLMGELFDRFAAEHVPPVKLAELPHNTHVVWPIGNNPPQPVPAIEPTMPSPTVRPITQKIRDANETARVIKSVVRDMVTRGELYIACGEDECTLNTLPEVTNGNG